MFANFWNWLLSLFGSKPAAPVVPAPTPIVPLPTPVPVPPIPVPVPAPAPGTPTIQNGATGSLVLQLQTKLIALGFLAPPADSDFGPITQAAVESFQTVNGLPANGVVNQTVWNVLNGSPKPLPPPAPGSIKPRPSNAGNIRVCLGANILEGLDISNDEPGTNWNLVAQSGRKFAFVKATEGLSITDSEFAVNWKVGRAFLAMGAYHFLRARDTGAAQAAHYLSVLGKLNVGDLPPMLDLETLDGQSAATCIKSAQDWLDAVEAATGRVPIIYTDDETMNALGNPQQFFRYPLFVANIEATCPSTPPPWTKSVFWQYSWTGSVNGVKVPCDVDRFNGTAAQLQDFIRNGTLPF